MIFSPWTGNERQPDNGILSPICSIIRKSCLLLLFCTSVPLLTACSATSKTSPEYRQNHLQQKATEDNLRIAQLLVGTLAQLPGFEPLSFTVQVTPPMTNFGQAIMQSLRQYGYGLQKVKHDQGRNYVSYARTEIVSDTGFVVEYSVTIWDVRIYRQFATAGKALTPVSPTTVVGIEAQLMNLQHDTFQVGYAEQSWSSGVVFKSEEGSDPVPAVDVNKIDQSRTRREGVGSLVNLSSAVLPDLDHYVVIRVEQVQFPSADINFLGEQNKHIIQQLADNFTPQRNLITLAGCFSEVESTQGQDAPTNRSLQLQERVRRELLSAGVAKNSIRVTACSGGNTGDSGQHRSVILTLRQLKQTG